MIEKAITNNITFFCTDAFCSSTR